MNKEKIQAIVLKTTMMFQKENFSAQETSATIQILQNLLDAQCEKHNIKAINATVIDQKLKTLNKKLNDILKVCEGHEDLMWSAKIIGIILDCDFRDAKTELEKRKALT